MREKWVFFDLDGTLTQSEEGIWNCARYAAEKMGFPQPAEETLKKWIGPPLIWSFQHLMGMTEAQAWQAQEYYRERYTTVGKYENRVYPGVRRMLRALKRGGVRMGIVTGKPEQPTRDILAYFGILRYFERIACATDAKAEKEHLIRSVMPEEPAEVWMVGDRRFDMEGGAAAGVHTLGAAWGYGSEEELRTAGAERIAFSAWEAAKILCPDAEMPKGAFLSMEGLDGSGKSTQMEKLTGTLERFGFEVEHSREPGGTPIGEKIRELLLSRDNMEMTDVTEALLYAAARAQHVRERIRPALAAGKVLLCDRFLDSSVAYQGGGRRLGVDQVLALNALAVEDTLPLAVVYLDLDHRTSLRRRSEASELDRLEMEKESFHARVEEGYHALIARHPERYVVVDARGDREEIAKTIAAAVLEKLMAAEEKE
ncbi:MAG: dTMP kinase [Clostridia bacterium]|nr:dTMP kinase [Clostridia bacterium]